MDLLDAIRSRRTTNGPFEDRPLDPTHVQTILEMAACAPSHFNSQPWRFVVIQDQTTRMQLAEIAGESMQKLMAGAASGNAIANIFVSPSKKLINGAMGF